MLSQFHDRVENLHELERLVAEEFQDLARRIHEDMKEVGLDPEKDFSKLFYDLEKFPELDLDPNVNYLVGGMVALAKVHKAITGRDLRFDRRATA